MVVTQQNADHRGSYARIPDMPPENESQDVPGFRTLDVAALPVLPGCQKDNFVFGSKKQVYEVNKKEKKKPGKARTIFKIFSYASKKDTAIFVLGFFSAIVSGLMSPLGIVLAVSPLLGFFIKQETPGHPGHLNSTGQASEVISYSYEYFILGAINFIFGLIQIIASEIAARNIMAKIKTAYLAKMLSIEIGWYDKTQEQFVSTVSHDLQKMMVLFDSKMTSAVEMLSFFFFGTLASIVVSWKVALITLVFMCVGMVIIYLIMQASKKKGKLRQQFSGECTKIASEVLGNARTVAAYGGEYREIERFKNVLKISKKYDLKHATVISMAKGFNYFQLCVCYVIGYYFSIRLFLDGEFDPSFFGIVVIGQINCVYHSTSILRTISDLFLATDSAYRVMEFLETETSYNKSLEQGITPDSFEEDVSFRGAQFSYPTALHTKALHDLTLNIEPGKVTAVVGTSGAGKSTIVGLISRLYDLSAGEVLIGGVDISKLNTSWLRDQIGVVGQEPMLFDATIEENIRLGKTSATLEEIVEAAKVAHAHSFIEKLPSGYSSIVGENGTKLSGGQKQRIAIARAIVKKPKLLLLDEATSALDSRSEGIVQRALDNAMRNRTTVIISHRISTIQKADVIYAMKEGRVVEKDTHQELMDLKGYYYSLVKIQELQEKENVVTLGQASLHKEEMIEEMTPSDEKYRVEEPQKGKKFILTKKNIKVFGIWFLAVLFTLITSTFVPVFHLIFIMLAQTFTRSRDEINGITWFNIGVLFVLAVIVFFSVIMTGMMSTLATQVWLKKLQMKAFNKVVSMDISWFDRIGNSPNECLEILTNSPPLIESVTGDRAAEVVIFVLSLVFCFMVCFFVSTSVTLANFPVVFIFIVMNCLRMKSRQSDKRSASLATRSTKVATEYVQNVKTIQLLNCQKYIISQYEEMLKLSKKEAYTSIGWYAVVYALMKALMRFTMAVTFISGAYEIADGNVKGSIIIGVINGLSSASMLAGPAMISLSQYPAARQAMARLYRIAYSKSSLKILTDEGAKPEIRGDIVFEDVTFSYPTRNKVQVLKKLNLKIEAGKTVALIGDSGCGKSTIISLLERFYLPTGGKIIIDGTNIDDINVRFLRSQMGLVSQEPVLFDMTIKENILYGLEEEVMMEKIIEAAKVANIHDFIMKLPQAYDTPVGERGSKLSGGQKQRIAIARAVLRNPKILLLDEATSALDNESEKAVQEALENASVGKTTIVIAHRLSTIREADKIVVLQSGVVEEEGTHEELMQKRGHYFNLVNR